MSNTTQAWKVATPPDPSKPPIKLKAGSIALEEHLEGWIEADPQMLQPGLVIIGRQVGTVAGPIDLLAIDEAGALVVIELKRGSTYRVTVAQVIDYGAAVARMAPAEVQSIAEKYIAERKAAGLPAPESWEAILADELGIEPGAWIPGQVRLVVAGAGTDPEVERMVEFLAGRFSVPINAHSFDVYEDGTDLVIVRKALLSDSETADRSGNSRGGTDADLRAAAERADTLKFVEPILEFLESTQRKSRPEKTWWSIKRPYPDGKVVVFRIYPEEPGYPEHLYIWPRLKSLAEDLGKTAAECRAELEATCGVLVDECIEIKSEEQVKHFLELLRQWYVVGEDEQNGEEAPEAAPPPVATA